MRIGWMQRNCLLLLIVLFASSCSKNSTEDSDPANPIKFRLSEIYWLYDLHAREKSRAPTRIADFQAFEQSYPHGLQTLKTGDVVVYWGYDMRNKSEGDALILAYEKAVPTDGGWVVLTNSEVKKMSADEFHAAAKAKK